jgi:glycosyltransferase involved in cell wall biosynthesis
MTTTVGRPERQEAPDQERRLRIVLVEFLPSGGMFQFSFQFATALAQAGHTVTLLTGPDPELTSRVDGLQVRSLLPTWHPNVGPGRGRRGRLRRVGRALRLLESWRRVLGYLLRERPDVAQFGELRFVLDSAALAILAGLVPGTTFVDVAHNPLPYNVDHADRSVEKGGRLTRALLARAYAHCGVVLVLGEGPRQQLREHFPAVTRVAICGHGDYASVLRSADVPPPSAAPPAALFFGAWTKYKNIPLLLDAFALVRAGSAFRQSATTLPEARLTLAGPVMPDVDVIEIQARAEAIGQVDLRPGYVPMEDLPALFAAHRVVMFTYETVNVSGSVHMAYTFGRPVVATEVGAMADSVRDGETGLLVPPDPASVAQAMITMLDPATADRMGAAAARHAHQAASWSGVADRAVAAYRSALAARST